MSLGVLVGLLAALFQSGSYLWSRLFVKKFNNDFIKLFAVSHVIMGVIAIGLAAFLWPETAPEPIGYTLCLLGYVVFYIIGQLLLFSVLVDSEASRVSPLLGIKVFMLAVINYVFFHHELSVAKWAAVILSSYAAFLLSNSGKKLHFKSLMLILLACLFYCGADLSIKALLGHLTYLSLFHRAAFGTALGYILCGLFGLSFLFIKRIKPTKGLWLYSLPYAVCWFISMLLLFSCFALVGIVFGNILQSTRGLMSIILGYLIAHFGFEALETKITKKVLIQRILAAILMTCSVALFYYSD